MTLAWSIPRWQISARWRPRQPTSVHLTTANRVGFAPEVALDDQLSGTLRTVYRDQIEASIKILADGNLNALVREQGKLSTVELDLVFGPGDKLLLDYNLNPAQLATAKRLIVLRSSLPSTPGISRYAIFIRQNVQERVEFFNRNRDFMRQQAVLPWQSVSARMGQTTFRYARHWPNKAKCMP